MIISIDTETQGIYPYKGDRLFSIQIATATEEFFYTDINSEELYRHVENADVYILHNIKFDLSHIKLVNKKLFDIITGPNKILFDTKVAARLIKNNLPAYSLDALTGKKLDTVKKYVSKHKLYTNVKIEGKKRVERLEHYDKVPLEILEPYGKQDARITYDLGVLQKGIIEANDFMHELFHLEMKLIMVVFKMEELGISLDVEYTERTMKELLVIRENLLEEYFKLTGNKNPNGRKDLVKALEADVGQLPITEKGNPCTDRRTLEKVGGKVADCILKIRDTNMKLGTFFSSYLFLKDNNGVIHPNFDPSGTDTGRFSCNHPNLQQCSKDEEIHSVRRCFVPRKGYKFVSIDYDQMEFRLLLDLAKEDKVIDLIVNENYDVHKATAELMSRAAGREITREQAKTINFMLIYGGGAGKLAAALKVDYNVAKLMRETYMRALPKSTSWMNNVMQYAMGKKQMENIYGRVYYFDDAYYKAVNYCIQGSCAEIIKRAMIYCDGLLKGKQSRLLLSIHDELLFEIHETEMDCIEKLRNVMENVYTFDRLQLTAKVNVKKESWEK